MHYSSGDIGYNAAQLSLPVRPWEIQSIGGRIGVNRQRLNRRLLLAARGRNGFHQAGFAYGIGSQGVFHDQHGVVRAGLCIGDCRIRQVGRSRIAAFKMLCPGHSITQRGVIAAYGPFWCGNRFWRLFWCGRCCSCFRQRSTSFGRRGRR